MAGYHGYSMSNNAVEAYESGEKPISKWTKAEIIEAIEEAIEEAELELICSFEKLKKTPAKVLKDLCLSYSSWHHTSSHFNRTDFYSLNFQKIARLTDDRIESEIKDAEMLKKMNEEEEKWECEFLEWSGTRKHPVAKETKEIGFVKGDWFYRENGSKKKTTANGFKFIRKII